MNIKDFKRIHFIGIGGIGLSAIAKLMLKEGKIVSGSDIADSEIIEDLRKNGAKVFIGHNQKNITNDTDLVIYTLAVPANNPELFRAKRFKIPILTYPEALGLLFNSHFGVAICGTHGKSTTTAMIGLLLAKGGFDPWVVVGSKVPQFNGNARIGKGNYFIIEACEYERAFLAYHPKIIVLNNIELDHTDYYRDIDDYRGAFEEFVGHLPPEGVLIYNGDSIKNKKLKIKNKKLKIISFGLNKNNDLVGYEIKIGQGETKFKASFKGRDLGEFVLKIPGKFNVYNALGAMAVALHLDIKPKKIKEALANFSGIWRRFEYKGKVRGAKIFSDYAHHPTAIQVTIEAARQFFPKNRLMVVFQPHQHSRTKVLFKDFVKVLSQIPADVLIISEIFQVAGREEKKDQNIGSLDLVRDINQRLSENFKTVIARSERNERRSNPVSKPKSSGLLRLRQLAEPRNDILGQFPKKIFYAKDLDETKKLLLKNIKKNDIVLIMGAGDVYRIADELVGAK